MAGRNDCRLISNHLRQSDTDKSDWCAFTGAERFAGSVINRRLVSLVQGSGVWSPTIPGFVIAPEAVTLLCGYSADASTQHGGSACPAAADGQSHWCEPPGCCLYGDGGCAWRPEMLDQLMAQQSKARAPALTAT